MVGGRSKKLRLSAFFIAGELTTFNCEECGEKRKEQYGCTKETERPLYDHPVFGEIRRCPRKLITPVTVRMMRAYHHYKAGFLPGPGGAENQDYRTMRAIEIIGETVGDIESQRHEERMREMKTRGR